MRSCSEHEIRGTVRRLVSEQYTKVKNLLEEKKDRVEAIAKALIDRETLDAEELKAIFEGRELPPRQRVVIPTYAEKEKAKQDKRKAASIFGGPPKPATS